MDNPLFPKTILIMTPLMTPLIRGVFSRGEPLSRYLFSRSGLGHEPFPNLRSSRCTKRASEKAAPERGERFDVLTFNLTIYGYLVANLGSLCFVFGNRGVSIGPQVELIAGVFTATKLRLTRPIVIFLESP